MIRFFISTLFLIGGLQSLFAENVCATNEKQTHPKMLFNLNYNDMLNIKTELSEGKPEIVNAYSQIILMADSMLNLPPLKVTDGDMPPSGNPHDIFTIGKYAFPNPNTPDGMPYIRKDGVINEEAYGYKYDLARYDRTIERVNVLSLAWFYSGNEKYADKAAEFLRVWFLNSETKMNPNFNCAAALPGVYDGMAIGIIFGVKLIDFLDHVQLLTLSDSWTNTDNTALKTWFNEYAEWLLTSKFGIEESRAKNNHGSWYSAQVAAAAVYNGNVELAKQMIDKGKTQIAELIEMNNNAYPNGAMPHELRRNQSFLYSLYGLESFCALAGCGAAIGYDLWHFETPDGRGIKVAFEFLVPYLLEKKQWTYESLRPTEELMPKALHIVRQAAAAYKTADLIAAQEHVQQYAKDDPLKWLERKNYYHK